MSTTVVSILLGLKYKDRSCREAEKLLDNDKYGELERVKDEALELTSQYNETFEMMEKYLDEPYQTSFAATMALNPKESWKRLGYCEALSNYNEKVP